MRIVDRASRTHRHPWTLKPWPLAACARYYGQSSSVSSDVSLPSPVISLGIVGLLGLAALGYRQKSAPRQIDLANRLFHFRSEVNFRNLRDERRITFTLSFLNATDYVIVLDDVTGAIAYDNFLDAGVQPSPQLGQRKTDNEPLQEFKVVLEQHVSRELADNLLERLCGGEPITINLENLLVPVRSKSRK